MGALLKKLYFWQIRNLPIYNFLIMMLLYNYH